MIDIRLRSRISDAELESKVGKILTEDDFNVLLHRDCTVRKPDGSLLCIYLRGALDDGLLDSSYDVLHELRKFETLNRGLASGTRRIHARGGGSGSRTMTKPVPSAIIGAFDPAGQERYCRLTAWTGEEWDRYTSLFPLFREVGRLFAENVPDRYKAQMAFAERTRPDWVIRGTPFTTITVNNTYPTGVHTDKGDLDEGFSCLAVMRYGEYSGGCLTFPRYRVAADLHHGDLLLMDAHEWHGNTAMELLSEDAERISIVCYYRTKMAECGTPAEEALKGASWKERRNLAAVRAD